MRLLDQATDIETNDFTQNSIDHREISFAPKTIPKVRLGHSKCGLYVAAFVVMSQKILRDEIGSSETSFPEAAAAPCMNAFKCDVRHDAVPSEWFCSFLHLPFFMGAQTEARVRPTAIGLPPRSFYRDNASSVCQTCKGMEHFRGTW
jgi:hypothetical protein